MVNIFLEIFEIYIFLARFGYTKNMKVLLLTFHIVLKVIQKYLNLSIDRFYC